MRRANGMTLPGPPGWPGRLVPRLRRRHAVARALAPFALPDDVRELIERTATGGRLWPRECAEVARELATHFEDGMEAGLDAAVLIETFGDAGMTGALIGRALRRQRPVAWQAARCTAIVAGVVALAAAIAYLASAASLYLSEPAHIRTASISPEKNAREAASIWKAALASYEADIRRANLHLEEVRGAALRGDECAAVAHIAGALDISDVLRSRRDIYADYAAALIERDAANAMMGGLEAGNLCTDNPRMAIVRDRLAEPVRLDGVRATFQDLLDRMYTRSEDGDGHLTSAGLELMRTVKNWHTPTFTDRLMEPVWYAFPASRTDVADRFEALVLRAERAPVGGGSIMDAIVPLARSMDVCLRFPALSVALPRLAEVLTATEVAGRARLEAVEALTSPAHRKPYNG